MARVCGITHVRTFEKLTLSRVPPLHSRSLSSLSSFTLPLPLSFPHLPLLKISRRQRVRTPLRSRKHKISFFFFVFFFPFSFSFLLLMSNHRPVLTRAAPSPWPLQVRPCRGHDVSVARDAPPSSPWTRPPRRTILRRPTTAASQAPAPQPARPSPVPTCCARPSPTPTCCACPSRARPSPPRLAAPAPTSTRRAALHAGKSRAPSNPAYH